MGINNTADTTADYDKKDIEDNKLMGVLAYIGLLFLIPLFAAKESKFAQFHTNQGILLCIVGVAGTFVGLIPILVKTNRSKKPLRTERLFLFIQRVWFSIFRFGSEYSCRWS